MTSRSTSSPTRVRRRVAVLVVLVLVLLAAPFVAPFAAPGAHAATPPPTPTSTPAPTGFVTVTLAPGGNGVVPAGSPLTVAVAVDNDTVLTQSAGRFVLEAGATAFGSRAALKRWLDGSVGDVSTTPIATTAVDAIDARDGDTVGMVVPASDPALRRRAPGVYPLLVRYERGGTSTVSTSALIVPRTDAATTPVTVVVPITAGPLTAGLLTADQLTALTAPDGALTAQLDAVTGSDAVLAVDPAIPAAIRVLGTSAPDDATAWLARLLDLPNERFALQFGDADLVAQLDAGLSPLLRPRSLQAYMEPDDFPAPTPTPGQTAPADAPSPSPTAGDDAPAYPELRALLDIGTAHRGVFWPVAGTADTSAVEELGHRTPADVSAMTLVPSDSTAGGADARAVSAAGSVGDSDARVLVYDAAASDALQAASRAEEWTEQGRALTSAAALLAMAARDAGDSPLLVTVGRAVDRAPGGLAAALLLTEGGPFRPASLDELMRTTPRPMRISNAAAEPARAAAARLLSDDESRLTSFATILSDPTLLTGPERAEMLQLLGAGWADRPDAWKQALSDHRTTTRTTLDAVGLLPPPRINLFAAGAGLGFWVRNDLPFPVDVVLSAIPDDLRVDVQRTTTVHALPQSNTRVDVPVQSRVSSGEVGIELQLRSRTNVLIGAPQVADVNVRAEWEGIGVGILGVLVAALILFGLWRTIRRRRRAAADAEAAAAAEAAETSGVPAVTDPAAPGEDAP